MGTTQVGYPQKDLTSCALCVKYLLFAMNFVYFAAGCAMLGVSLWIYLERNFVSAIFGTELMTAAILLLCIIGAVAIVISFLGCCGAVSENQTMVLMYMGIMALMFLSMILAGVLAIVYQTQLGEEVRGEMRSVLQNSYGVNLHEGYNRMITDAWDQSQEFLECCAVEDASWNTYMSSAWHKEQPGAVDVDKPFVPISCCKRDKYDVYIDSVKCQTWILGPPAKQSGERNEALHYRGCYYAGVDFARSYAGCIIGLGIGIGLSVVAGVVFSFILYNNLRKKNSVI